MFRSKDSRRRAQNATGGVWASRLRRSFLPVIRERGEGYAGSGRVRLEEFSETRIAGVVDGTVEYKVELVKGGKVAADENVRTSCTCPFFRQGFPCKHLWAAILEADRLLSLEGAESGPVGMRDAETGVGQAPAADIDRNWRNFFSRELFRRAAGPSASREPEPGSFVPVYRLYVGERELLFSAVERYVKKDGTLGRKRKFSRSRSGCLPAADRMLMAMIDNIRQREVYAFMYSSSAIYEEVPLEQSDLEVLLPLLADTGRCVVEFWKKGVVADPLLKGKPFQAGFRLGPEPVLPKDTKGENSSEAEAAPVGHESSAVLPRQYDEKGRDSADSIRLYPIFFVSGPDEAEKPFLPRNVDCIFNTDPLMFIVESRLHHVPNIPFRWISRIYPARYIEVARDEVHEFVSAAESLPDAPSVELPPDLAPKEVDTIEPAGVAVIELGNADISIQLLMDYEGIEVELDDPRDEILDTDRWIRIKRNFAAEDNLERMVRSQGFSLDGQVFRREARGISSVLEKLAEAGFRLEARNRGKVRRGAVTAFSVSSGMDWFDLEGGVSFGNEIVPLPRVVHEFLKGKRTINLSDGSVGVLPDEWLARYAPLLDMADSPGTGKGKETRLRFPSTRGLLLDALLEENEAEAIDDRFLEFRRAVREFRGIEKVDVPKGFRGVLRSYQRDTLGWFAFLRKMKFGGILADDMGLGKTVQVLAWLAVCLGRNGEQGHGDSRQTALVVVPTSLVFNWQSEAARFVPGFKVMIYGGQDRRKLFDAIRDYDLVITTYGLMRRDIELLRGVRFEYAILDESQAIKNPASQTAKAARLLRAAHRLCLTGTPLENNAGELWSQMEFLNPGMLGSRAAFERKFLRPVERDDKNALELLKTVVKPFILRRTKDMVASDLPEKMEQTVFCTMPPEQADIYRKLRRHYRGSILASVEKQGMGATKIKVLEALLRLRQAACHPALVGYQDKPSGKLAELMALVEEAVAGGHKALIFSQFTSMLSIIRHDLDSRGISYEYLDGRVPQKKRKERVTRFQEDDDIKLFLISLKAGGVGLNLTAADYVFIVDPWWNPAVELQAVDRTHRIGQDKRVFTYRLITAGTVEEKVLTLQQQKRELVTNILSGSGDMLKNLSARDLEVLFS